MNGVEIETPTRLRNGDRIWVGNAYCFVFEDPLESPPQGGFMTYQLAYKERLKSDGYRDPDEVEAELRAQAEEMQRRLDNAIEKQKADAERKLAAQEAKVLYFSCFSLQLFSFPFFSGILYLSFFVSLCGFMMIGILVMLLLFCMF